MVVLLEDVYHAVEKRKCKAGETVSFSEDGEKDLVEKGKAEFVEEKKTKVLTPDVKKKPLPKRSKK